MIEFKEHIYDDDPNSGHPDARTRLKDAAYFFIGNGLISASIQFAPAGEGSPFGLLIMNPDVLRKKREALTFDPETGLENTALIFRDILTNEILNPESISAEWNHDYAVPAACYKWSSKYLTVEELFYCPDRNNAHIIREIRIDYTGNKPAEYEIQTGVLERTIKQRISFPTKGNIVLNIQYELVISNNTINLEFIDAVNPDKEVTDYWQETTKLQFDSPLLDHLFRVSCYHLPAVISNNGVIDASIWQYNREWVRDHSFMAIGLILSGHHKTARLMLKRLLDDFVSDDGDAIDSSEKRHTDEVELDQNGILLYTLKTYSDWTGDYDFISENWKKIQLTAEFPLKKKFRHDKSGMLFNRRDFWERHSGYGIEYGLEFAYQYFTVTGLESVAYLAEQMGKSDEGIRWKALARELKESILNHPDFALIDERGFIKRRGLDGTVQETLPTCNVPDMPESVPIRKNITHYLNPDSSTALPIAMGFIPPDSQIALSTLDSLEILWNQDWDDGGYGRYHFSSEPDSAGSWPFSSIIIARAYMETGNYEKVWRVLKWMNTLPGSISGSWLEMYGPRVSPPFPQVGIIPWTWAEMIMLFIQHIVGIKPGENSIYLKPKLLPGINGISGHIPFRNNLIHLNIRTDPGCSVATFKTDSRVITSGQNDILIEYSGRDISIEATLPVNQ
ncbi:MAG: hypothetical protein P9L92_10475 [Candidatus Electryonea clarkiae]|nr:hypothetical protein [Candidatus Electryonea clarkiae]MDP8289219.1 hypothetical protein [Candidatus Electryonea clarkiae]